ncbi:DUF4857 domain-containing protein [Carboxylicivirga sp. A043]|uniref:DUF4857 domain-containing protein n=1 Tax=Carboxylicivirga litoralis TaxID=2816963 RepID=UPI0021CAFC86|nr:DUF4857 domain-containing protein [Carboxylicivirga sp. A043]MCU4155526.1 DUF4857 domain-containing protein [Carboxylicivirga sp. A043]
MKPIRYTIIILASIILAWLLPSFYHLLSDSSGSNAFTYYSSVEEAFCSIDFDEQEERLIRYNVKTNQRYSEAEFDSILPFFYYRQLLSDGRLPDSINGRTITLKEVNSKTFFYRYNAKDKNTPSIPIYTLFESFSGRVRLEMPGDVFRLKNKIEFINPETNGVDKEKSERFMRAFETSDFQFPARAAYGNPSTRKPYDEGYFIIDNDGQIFHLKMVNGKAFLKNTNFPATINPVYISTQEPDDRSYYAFVFDDENNVYLMTSDNYRIETIPTPGFNRDKGRLMIMANPMYWNVNVLSSRGKECYALNADTKEVVDSLSLLTPEEYDFALANILPVELRFTSGNTDYIKPSVRFATWWVLLTNLILVAIFVFIGKRKNKPMQLFEIVWIGISGIFGFIPCLIFKE